MKRYDAVESIWPHLGHGRLVVCCNGMISREVFSVGDRPQHFYMIGSMGLASSIGLGLAQMQEERDVVVVDGDGNMLMNLGTLTNVGAARLTNYYHILLDNGVHDSTGGQKTVCSDIALEKIALASGYQRVEVADTWDILNRKLATFFDEAGPALLRVIVEPGNLAGIGRVDITPPEMAKRFRKVAMGMYSR